MVALEWVEIDVPGEIFDLDSTYSEFVKIVGITSTGAPLVAAVDGTRIARVAAKVPDSYGSGATSPTGDYGNDGFVQQSTPRLGLPAHLYVGDIDVFGGGPFESWHRDVLVDDDGPAVWASLLFDDEGDLRAVGARRDEGKDWRAQLWEVHPDDGEWRIAEAGRSPRLRGVPSTSSLVTSTEEVRVLLAENHADGPRLWVIDADPYTPQRWQRQPLEGGADTVTDILSWAIGTWVAGSRDNQAVLWDFDDGQGEVSIPRIELDPETPVVKVLRLPVAGQPAFATQSVDGPSVWVGGREVWRELKAPAGTLTAAAASDQGIYLVIDGTLWFRYLPWDRELP